MLYGSTAFIPASGPAAPDVLLVTTLVALALTALVRGLGSGNLELAPFFPWLILWGIINTSVALAAQDSGYEALKAMVGLMYFFIPVAALLTPGPPTDPKFFSRAFIIVVILIGLRMLVAVDQEGIGVRESLGFPNPNHAGSWAAAALLLSLLAPAGVPFVLRSAAVLGCALALVLAQSFASFFALAAAMTYLIFTLRRGALSRLLGFVIVVIGLAVAAPHFPLFQRVSETEFLRSGDDRLAYWSEGFENWLLRPLGSGFDAAVTQSGYEMHNDYLTFLVALGPGGLILFAALLYIVFKRGGAVTRTLVVLIAVTAALQPMSSWRHMWLSLAVAFTFDSLAGRSSEDSLAERSSGAESSAQGIGSLTSRTQEGVEAPEHSGIPG